MQIPEEIKRNVSLRVIMRERALCDVMEEAMSALESGEIPAIEKALDKMRKIVQTIRETQEKLISNPDIYQSEVDEMLQAAHQYWQRASK